MRFISTLIAKRDAAHAEYLKWQTMIDTLAGDRDFARMDGVKSKVATLPQRTATYRSSASRRMKKLWKERREEMIKHVKKGAQARARNRQAAAVKAVAI